MFGHLALKRFFSFLLLIALLLFPWTQPALADDQVPQKPVRTVAYIGYPPLDAKDPKDAKSGTNRILVLETKSDYTYLATGPLFTEEGFRYAWICPNGATLIDNACYAKAESGEKTVLKDPSGAQIAFGYAWDKDSTTNEQLVYMASIQADNFYSANDHLLEDDLQKCNNRRRCLKSICADNTTVYPPAACPR